MPLPLLICFFLDTGLQSLAFVSANDLKQACAANKGSGDSSGLIVGITFGLDSYPYLMFARRNADHLKLMSDYFPENNRVPLFLSLKRLRINQSVIHPNGCGRVCEMVFDFYLQHGISRN